MLEKIKNFSHHPYIQQFRDVRAIGLALFGVIVLLVTWSGVGALQTNLELQKQVARVEEQNKVSELENANLRLKNEYYNTDHYLELEARRQFGKAAPGETMVIVPKHVAMKHTIELPSASEEATPTPHVKKPLYQRNFEAWMRFFRGGK